MKHISDGTRRRLQEQLSHLNAQYQMHMAQASVLAIDGSELCHADWQIAQGYKAEWYRLLERIHSYE